MTLDTAKKILEPYLLDETSGWLDIIFVGAETLMAIDVIVPLVEWAEKVKTGRDFRFFGSTNGTLLTDGMKEWLTDHRRSLILGLSYDGLPSTQRDNRGNDSIDVDFFVRTWPGQQIQMTIDSKSVKDMAAGVIYLLEKGARVHPNVAFEKLQWSDDAVAEYANQLNILIGYYASHGQCPLISQFRHNLVAYANCIDNPMPQQQICGAGNGFTVYDVDGKSYPCHMLSPLVLEVEKLAPLRSGCFSQKDSFSDPQCEGCPYAAFCPTCLASNYIYRGAFCRRDSTHCRIMKTEVRAFIKMEVLRLTAKKILTPEDATEIDAIDKLQKFLERH